MCIVAKHNKKYEHITKSMTVMCDLEDMIDPVSCSTDSNLVNTGPMDHVNRKAKVSLKAESVVGRNGMAHCVLRKMNCLLEFPRPGVFRPSKPSTPLVTGPGTVSDHRPADMQPPRQIA